MYYFKEPYFLLLRTGKMSIALSGALLTFAFLNGCFVASYGPLIPLFSEATGLDETEFSYLFMVRSASNVVGGIMVKQLLKRFSTQTNTLGLIGLIIFGMITSTFSLSTFNLTISLFIASLGLISTCVILYAVIFQIYKNEDAGFYIQLFGFTFGIGTMMSPIIVMIFKLNTMLVLGFAHFILAIVIMNYRLPKLDEEKSHEQREVDGKMRISRTTVKYICLIFFFFATNELGVGSWIPTYAIKANITDVNGSGFYSLLFWVPNCFTRLLWMYIPGSIQQRLGIALKGVFLISAVALFLQFIEAYYALCYILTIGTGLFIGCVYGFGIAIAADSGFEPNASDNADFVLANALGQGLLITPIGYSMHIFGHRILPYELLLFSICNWICYNGAVSSMIEDKKEFNKRLLGEQLPQKQKQSDI